MLDSGIWIVIGSAIAGLIVGAKKVFEVNKNGRRSRSATSTDEMKPFMNIQKENPLSEKLLIEFMESLREDRKDQREDRREHREILKEFIGEFREVSKNLSEVIHVSKVTADNLRVVDSRLHLIEQNLRSNQ